jgi:hypothetical protein
MSGTENRPANRRPFFTWAAWLSLIVPLIAVGVFLAINDPQKHGEHALFATLTFVFAAGFLTGCVSLAGVRTNGAWVILPPAILGMLVNLALGLLALIYWALSYGPRSP